MKVEQIRAQMMNNPYKPTAVLLSALDETACKIYVLIVYLLNSHCCMFEHLLDDLVLVYVTFCLFRALKHAW